MDILFSFCPECKRSAAVDAEKPAPYCTRCKFPIIVGCFACSELFRYRIVNYCPHCRADVRDRMDEEVVKFLILNHITESIFDKIQVKTQADPMGIDFGKAVTKLSSSTIHRSSASNHPANLRLIALLPVCARLSPVRGESSFASMIRRALQGERLEGLAGELIKIAEDENIARSVAQSVVDKITGISKSESA